MTDREKEALIAIKIMQARQMLIVINRLLSECPDYKPSLSIKSYAGKVLYLAREVFNSIQCS